MSEHPAQLTEAQAPAARRLSDHWRGATATVAIAPALIGCGRLIADVPQPDVPVVWAGILLLAFASTLAYVHAQGWFDLFSPPTIVLSLIAIQFPVQAFYTVLLGRYGSQLLPTGRWAFLIGVSMGLAAVASIAFMAGYLLPRVRPSSSPRSGPGLHVWSQTRVTTTVIWLSVIGIASYYDFMSKLGGVVYFVHNLQSRVALAAGRHDLLAGVALLPLASLIWYAHIVRRPTRPRGAEMLLFASHVALASFMLFTLGGRSNLIEFWLGLLVIHHYGVRRLGLRVALLFLATAVAFLSLAGWYRASTAASVNAPRFTPSDVLSPRKVANEVLNYDVSPLDVFVLALQKVPREIPYRMGGSIADTVYQPIPRSMLPNKPPVLTAWYKSVLLDRTDGGGVRASALGEGYINFGYPGVVGLLFAYGALGSLLRMFAARRGYSATALVLYALAAQLLIQLTIGAFDESAVNFLERALPLAIAARYLSSRHAPAAAPRPGSSPGITTSSFANAPQ